MLRSFLTLALRNITREFTYSSINILGLTVGIASSIIILLWVSFEHSYDDFHANKGLIVRPWRNTVFTDRVESRSSFPYRGAEEMLKYPQVEKAAVAWFDGSDELLAFGESRILRPVVYVTPEYLQIFQFPAVRGQLENALTDTYSIVLTEPTAKALFGDQDPLNKIVRFQNAYDLRVTAVLKTIPANSTVSFHCLVPFALFEVNTPWAKECLTDWDCDWFKVTLELKPGTDLEALNQAIIDLPAKFANQHPVAKEQMFLYPLERWHLHSNFENGAETDDDRADYVQNILWLAVIILVVACINFMNLATARSARRGREVGIRKISGSVRSQLILQFIGESMLITFIAFALALLLVEASRPLVELWMESPLKIDYTSWQFWLASLGGIFITGLVAGSYPAFYLSSFAPIKVLTAKTGVGRVNSLPRKVLVISQFGVSILLIIGALAIRQQVQLGIERHTGFDKEGLITVRDNSELAKYYPVLKQKLLLSGLAKSVVKTNSPVTDIYEVNYLTWDDNAGPPVECVNIFTEYDYTRTLGIKMLQGRDFSPRYASDTAAVIFNETAAEIMGFENPIGEEIFIGDQKRTIVGIMENVVMTSPFDKVDPLYMVLHKHWDSLANRPNITIRLTDRSRIEEVGKIVTSFAPGNPFEFRYVDQEHKDKFSGIILLAQMTNVFALLAVAIAAMGLFGLASFTAEQRQKEMSIRKVLGSSVAAIISLLSRDFIRLVIVSFVIFAPIGGWLVDDYLDRFSYRVEISWWMYLLSVALVFLVTLTIVGRQGWRAATMNPIESLRNE